MLTVDQMLMCLEMVPKKDYHCHRANAASAASSASSASGASAVVVPDHNLIAVVDQSLIFFHEFTAS